MLGLGNPLHAFDHANLAGGKIVVRRARFGEKLRTLDGVERDLDPSDLMIADAAQSIALPGIMGGEETAILEGTAEGLLEVAREEQDDILTRLGNERRDGEYVIPTWRARDLTREVDLMEEVARFRLG